jgi:tRNA 5-methylaminomethyl-2-thiouridine biosynthesis bifunctional protein
LRTFARVAPAGTHDGAPVWSSCGIYQRAADADEAQRWRSALTRAQMPGSYVRWLDAIDAAELAGVLPAQAGLWWPNGTVASPARVTSALLQHARIRVMQQMAASIEPDGDEWRICTSDRRVVARAPVVIVAAGLDTPQVLRSRHFPVRAVAGQVTAVDAVQLQSMRGALAGDVTLLLSPEGAVMVGATYELVDDAATHLLDQRAAARSNLARLERLLAAPVDAPVVGSFGGVRCVARDRLPYAGAIADEPAALAHSDRLRGAHFDDLPRRAGLYTSFALGSRGLTFAALAAELVAARIEGEPLPVERDLAGALDPARALLQRLRHGLDSQADRTNPHVLES